MMITQHGWRAVAGTGATVALLGLGGCSVGDGGARQQEAQETIAAALAEIGARQEGGVRLVDRPWYGEALPTRTERGNGDPLPARTERADSIVVHVVEPMAFDRVVPLLETASGIPVTWVPVALAATGEGGPDTSRPQTAVRISHHGPLSSLLDRLAREWDIAWDYDGDVIRLHPLEVRHHDLPVSTASTTFSSSAQGLSGFGGGSLTSSSSASFSAWDDMSAVLEGIPDAIVRMQPAAGRVMVAARPSVQRLVEREIERFRAIYGQRVGLEVTTWFLSIDEMDEAGIGLSAIFTGDDAQFTLGNPGASPTTRTGGVRIIADDSEWAGSEAFFTAAASAGAVVDRVQASTVTLTGEISPIILGRERKFVTGTTSETTTNDAGQSVTTRTPEIEEVVTGISLFVLPRVLERDQVHMSVWINQQQLVATHQVPTGDGGSVLLPETDGRNLSWSVTMQAGSRLVLGGYEQELHNYSSAGTGEPGFWLLGGRDSSESKRVQMVITVRPVLLGA